MSGVCCSQSEIDYNLGRMGMRRSARLAAELGDRCVALGERHVSWHVLRRLCRAAEEKTTSGDLDCLRLAGLAVRIAGRLVGLQRWRRRPAESRELALSFGQLATALRFANRLDHAEIALRVAFEASPPWLKGVLYRRRAWIRIYQGENGKARKDARRAVDLALEEDRAFALGTLLSRRRRLERIQRRIDAAYQLARTRAWIEDFIGPQAEPEEQPTAPLCFFTPQPRVSTRGDRRATD